MLLWSSWRDSGIPGGSEGKVSTCNSGELGLIPRSGRSPWRRKWQPTSALLPGKCQGQRSLVGYSQWHRQKSYTTEQLYFTLIILKRFWYLKFFLHSSLSHDFWASESEALQWNGSCGQNFLKNLRTMEGMSLVVQWLKICLPMQGTWIWSLVEEPRSTCCRAMRYTCHK